MIQRFYKSLLFEYLDYFPCVAIIGSRQCGKTTLIKELPSDWLHFDLEKGSDLQQIEDDPDLFLRLNSNHIAIDEAQILPEIFSALRVSIDQTRSQKGRYVITGSSSPELIKSITESLAGRVGIIEMSPLSMHEINQRPSVLADLIFSGSSLSQGDEDQFQKNCDLHTIQNYWFHGGYPEPSLKGKKRFWDVWMSNFVTSYLQRDLKRLFPGVDEIRFRKFLSMLASLSGQIINYSEVARSLDISQPTVKDYFQIAHHTYLWRIVPSYEKNAVKRVVKHPKGFLRDSGLANHLLRIPDDKGLLSHPNLGSLWESLVKEEIIRELNSKGLSYDYYYYRTGGGAEVDLIIEGDFGVIPIEIKHGQRVRLKDLRGLVDFVEERHCAFGLVINNDERPRWYTEKILGIPFTHM